MSDGFGLFASALLGLSAITCGTAAFAGWRRRGRLLAQAGNPPAAGPSRPADLLRKPFASAMLDVAAEARDVLQEMAAEAAGHLVQLEFAAQPDLSVYADRLALRTVLCALIRNAVQHSRGGRVLLSAIRLGGRVQIAVIDDGVGPPAAIQQAALRELAQLVALQGGTIDIETDPGEGTAVLVRFLAPIGGQRASGHAPEAQPAGHPAASPTPARHAVVEPAWDR